MAKEQYVDGFVLKVERKNLKSYLKLAKLADKVWRDHGAIDYKETVSDDIKTDMGLSFAKLTKQKPSEVIIFSWITYKSKAHRNQVNKKVMKDPRLVDCMDPKTMPFDVKKMSYGGFKIIV